MRLYKVVIGVAFNKKLFSLSTVSGALADDLIEISTELHSKGRLGLFDKVGSNGDVAGHLLTLFDTAGGGQIELRTDQVVYSRSSKHSSLSVDKIVEEFIELYKPIAKRLGNPTVRRIGLFGEFLIDCDQSGTTSPLLVSALTKFPLPESNASKFHLMFNEIHQISTGPFDPKTSDYSNRIYTIYPSESDQLKLEPGGICASLDVQRYYNPAKSSVPSLLKTVARDFSDQRRTYKDYLSAMGLTDG